MHWGNPTGLLALAILPLLAVLLVHARRGRKEAAGRFVGPAMRRRLLPPESVARPWLKDSMLLAGLGLLIVAVAQPRFGESVETVAQRGVDVMVLLDVSHSMMADDVAPNRLERAKSDIRDLLMRRSGDQVGLIVFAGRPALKVPLTSDLELFGMVLEEIDTESAGRGGSLLGEAIRKGLEALPKRRNRDQVLVLISDGEDHDSQAVEAARQAAGRGVRIFAVGLGDSRQGARIPVAREDGHVQYLKYQGEEHWSKLNEPLLRKIALTSRGVYIPAGTRVYDLGQICEDHLALLAQGTLASGQRKRPREQYQWFLALGLLLLTVDLGIAGPWRALSEQRPQGKMP